MRRLEKEFKAGEQPMDVWHQVKLHYIGLLIDHHQPELAETFFNSVTTKILHRTYFHNDFIFVRPAVSTEYIENDEPAAKPTYRAYYPTPQTLRENIVRLVDNFQLQRPFEDLDRDAGYLLEAISGRLSQVAARQLPDPGARPCSSATRAPTWWARSSTASRAAVRAAHPAQQAGQAGDRRSPVRRGRTADAVLLRPRLLHGGHGNPLAFVQFLRSLMPRKPRAEIYNALGLAKQGKTLFYRDFLYHLKHSSDKFRIAPGIKGMVMLVFDLPSFPYVFKVIKDFYPPQKDTTREQIQGKYLPVKARPRRPHGRHAGVQRGCLHASASRTS